MQQWDRFLSFKKEIFLVSYGDLSFKKKRCIDEKCPPRRGPEAHLERVRVWGVLALSGVSPKYKPFQKVLSAFGVYHTESNRIIKVGKDLQHHPIQPSTNHYYFSTNLCPSVQHLNISWAPLGMVTQPLPWAACSSTWPLFWRSFC